MKRTSFQDGIVSGELGPPDWSGKNWVSENGFRGYIMLYTPRTITISMTIDICKTDDQRWKKGVAQFQTNELPLLFLKSPKFCGQMNACCSESQLKGHLLRVHHWARAEENQCGSEGPLSTNWLEIQHFCFQISRQGISLSISTHIYMVPVCGPVPPPVCSTLGGYIASQEAMHQCWSKESTAKHRRKMDSTNSTSFGACWAFPKAKQWGRQGRWG